jgi:plastocyanin
MANHSVTVLGINPDGTLILSDRESTAVNPGDTVTWAIGADAGTVKVTKLTDSSGTNIFSPVPVFQSRTATWLGTINPAAKRGLLATYNISYTIGSNPTESRVAAKIQVNP